MPNFVRELNHGGFSPLHIGAAVGNIEITRLLLSLDSGLCLVKDKQGRTPLHWAAMKGRVEIAGELISHCYEAVKEVSSSGETALDLAVKNNQFEVLEVLVEKLEEDDHDLLINVSDDQGNTIYQLTTSSGGQDRVQVQNLFKNQSIPEESRKGIANGESKKDGNKLTGQLGTVVASLIATMTYQAGLNPPQSIWHPGMKLHCSFRETLKISMLHPTEPCPAVSFYLFLLLNAIGFFSAVLYLCLGKEDKYLWQFSLACMRLTYICLSDTMMFNATTAIVLAAAVILVLVLWVAEDFLVHTAPNLKLPSSKP